MRIFKKKKEKDEGPFKADRFLDTPQLKLDQAYWRKDEKPVAIFQHTLEAEANKIGAKGYVGTVIGVDGEYEMRKRYVTRAIYFPQNLPNAQLDENTKEQILDSVRNLGALVPENIQFEKIEDEKTISISNSIKLKTNQTGYANLSGSFTVTPIPIFVCPTCEYSATGIWSLTTMKCPNCGAWMKKE